MHTLSLARAAARHSIAAVAEAALVVAVAGALAVGAAVATGHAPAAGTTLAASGGGSSIDLATVDGRAAAGVQPSLGDVVSFLTTYPKTVKNPRILVECYQDGALVFGMGGSVGYGFLLGGAGSTWLTNGGPAACTATLYYYGKDAGRQTFNPLATKAFSAGG